MNLKYLILQEIKTILNSIKEVNVPQNRVIQIFQLKTLNSQPNLDKKLIK